MEVEMAKGNFGTVINCMDGRTQLPVNDFLRKEYVLDYIDTVTEPGPVKMLAENTAGVESIKQRVNISIQAHGSKLIAIVAHYDCAGNPVPKETQYEQVKLALKNVSGWNYPVQLIGLWVNENWEVEPI
jgi:hypothetical protein